MELRYRMTITGPKPEKELRYSITSVVTELLTKGKVVKFTKKLSELGSI